MRTWWMFMDRDARRLKVKVNVTDSCLSLSYYGDNVLTTEYLESRMILGSHVADVVGDDGEQSVTVHYVKVVEGPNDSVTLDTDAVTILGTLQQCNEISVDIESLLKLRENHRPKRLLVFVNPASGWGNSVKQYKRIVAPIFEICNVSVHLVVTENANHAKNLLDAYDLCTIDGVVSMGGDGSVRQVVSAVMERHAKDVGIDINDPDAQITKPRLPVGVIPCGSGMAISVATNTSRDIKTGALNVVIGKTVNSDVIVMRNKEKFVGFGNIMECIGVLSNLMVTVEDLRWMGKLRYTPFVCLPILWSQFRTFDLQIDYKPIPESEREFEVDGQPGGYIAANSCDGPLPGWRTFRGRCASSTVIPWAQMDFSHALSFKENAYRKPTLSAGKALLAWIKENSFSKVLGCMKGALQGRRTLSPDICEQVEVSECRIRSAEGWSVNGNRICHDGDVLDLPYGYDLHMKVCANALEYFCIDDVIVSEARRDRTI